MEGEKDEDERIQILYEGKEIFEEQLEELVLPPVWSLNRKLDMRRGLGRLLIQFQ